ncbi:sulfotransferase [Sphingosinicella sp. BN140058]|uniref:sulfotransferase n=1 Tax=Sphingosinicella sp. BN140058 TaxID=1892855 RepID=UPI0013EA01E8|nr:sulfotransferase [Sphingosinicella sp. BN140058]
MDRGAGGGEGSAVGHLIHIGYPKTGSSFLRSWYRSHPQLAFTDRGFAGYSEPEAISRSTFAPPRPLRYRVTSAEGLATPSAQAGLARRSGVPEIPDTFAGQQDLACARLAEIFPNARILLVLRGIRSLLPSLHSQYLRVGGTLDFTGFCDAWVAALGADRRLWDYDYLVALYRRTFGAENVIVMPFELLQADPAAFTGALEARLGLAPHPPAPKRINPALSPAEHVWYPVLTRQMLRLPGPIGRTVRPRFLRAIRHGRGRGLAAALQRLRPRPIGFDPEAIERVAAVWNGRGASLTEDPLFAPFRSAYRAE